MGKLFGTDGVRGVANKDLTPELAYRLGRAGAYVLALNKAHKPTILVGMDTRLSGPMLENAMIAGICSTGATAVKVGVIPTPAIAYLTRKYEADAGVMISASHNSFEFNGIKFFSDQGYKLLDETEELIEKLVTGDDSDIPYPVGEALGRVEVCETAADDYLEYLLAGVDCIFAGKKIVLDCANGASFAIAPRLFTMLGASVIVIGNEPDGLNINEGCGSTHIENLQKLVREKHLDIGFAFDGDADRCLAVDENGNLVDGDAIIYILGKRLKTKGTLNDDTVVMTVMSNSGFIASLDKIGIKCVQTAVGDRFVYECMQNNDYAIGGEQSGHIIMKKYALMNCQYA